MLILSAIDATDIYVNAAYIASVHGGDAYTTIRLGSGHTIEVLDSADEVINAMLSLLDEQESEDA